MKRFMMSAAIVASGLMVVGASNAEAKLFGKKKDKEGQSSHVVYHYVQPPAYNYPAPTGYGEPTYSNGGYGNEYAPRETYSAPQPAPTWKPAAPSYSSLLVNRPSTVRQPAVNPQPTTATPVANDLPHVAPGSQITLSASNLGDNYGVVAMVIGGITMPIEIVSWTPEAVSVRMPTMLLNSTTAAELAVLRADGTLARSVSVALISGVAEKL